MTTIYGAFNLMTIHVAKHRPNNLARRLTDVIFAVLHQAQRSTRFVAHVQTNPSGGIVDVHGTVYFPHDTLPQINVIIWQLIPVCAFVERA